MCVRIIILRWVPKATAFPLHRSRQLCVHLQDKYLFYRFNDKKLAAINFAPQMFEIQFVRKLIQKYGPMRACVGNHFFQIDWNWPTPTHNFFWPCFVFLCKCIAAGVLLSKDGEARLFMVVSRQKRRCVLLASSRTDGGVSSNGNRSGLNLAWIHRPCMSKQEQKNGW